MATVITEMTMSLDGYVADPSDGVEELFGWYGNGSVEIPTVGGMPPFRVSEASAAHIRETMDAVGAMVTGRRLYDITHGWEGRHPFDAPVWLVTHEAPADPPPGLTVVTDGIEKAVGEAAAAAGDGVVGVGGGLTAQSCLDAGLLDEIRINLVPVLLGEGIPFFAGPSTAPVRLDDPYRVIQGTGVTHLYYRVR
ncbi:dihydrofolate reductase family protein [Spirillospora sp. CA-128828]|uniref:dihydrofolate reductase family protein n=1 Tax=Spirillospora sp. CA-128828 TaxID=3240033 RepID=UPI003D93F8DC